ncbi:RING-box protein 1-like [Drosophila obscura]|uniref:RING-box protein 1-like n=1 Tax=Drosophila obscura TaxID=7282 RepID=UPI000B9FF3EE|nr:RING-box protein 1-like [Drosophila obscura]
MEGDKEPPSDSSNGVTKVPHFQVKKWRATAIWAWDIAVDLCAICRNQMNDVCIECQASEDEINIEDCTIATGVCQHIYHQHCIGRWLRERHVCPLDNKEWEYVKCGR